LTTSTLSYCALPLSTSFLKVTIGFFINKIIRTLNFIWLWAAIKIFWEFQFANRFSIGMVWITWLLGLLCVFIHGIEVHRWRPIQASFLIWNLINPLINIISLDNLYEIVFQNTSGIIYSIIISILSDFLSRALTGLTGSESFLLAGECVLAMIKISIWWIDNLGVFFNNHSHVIALSLIGRALLT